MYYVYATTQKLQGATYANDVVLESKQLWNRFKMPSQPLFLQPMHYSSSAKIQSFLSIVFTSSNRCKINGS